MQFLNRPKGPSWRSALAWFVAGAAAFGASQLVTARAPEIAERIYGQAGPLVARLLSQATGWFPFSVAEVLLLAFAGWRLLGMARGIFDAGRRRRGWSSVISGGLRVALRDVGVGVFLFYFLWGWNYARVPVERRIGLEADGKGVSSTDEPRRSADSLDADAGLLFSLTRDLVDLANAAYVEIHGVEDAKIPTGTPDFAALNRTVEAGWGSAVQDVGLPASLAKDYGPAKRVFLRSGLARLGISGIYCPYTGEANVDGDIPAVALPHVMAHEKAHQRGFAPENEANFMGCLAALRSPDVYVRYSGAVFAQRQLLRALARANRPAFDSLLAARHPGVQRDIDSLSAYYRQYEGRASEISHRLNDAYLKTNRVEGGVASYGRSVELLLKYAAAREGKLTTLE